MRNEAIIRSVVVMLALLGTPIGALAADAPTLSGSSDVSLARSADVDRWNVSVQDAQGTNVSGSVKITGFPMNEPASVGKVNWSVAGSSVSGTINADAGHVLAWFKGERAGDKVTGTFTAVTGQSGTWEWEGTLPENPEQ